MKFKERWEVQVRLKNKKAVLEMRTALVNKTGSDVLSRVLPQYHPR